jgi:hypothetical protein
MSDNEKIDTLNYCLNRISREKWLKFLETFEDKDKDKDIVNFIKNIDLNDLEEILTSTLAEDEYDRGYNAGHSDGIVNERECTEREYDFIHDNEKIRSFLKVLMSQKVNLVVAASEFVKYMQSSHRDAEKFFTENGQIQTYNPTTEIDMMKMVVRLSHSEDWRYMPLNKIVGKIMESSGGRLNPSDIKNFLEDIGILV